MAGLTLNMTLERRGPAAAFAAALAGDAEAKTRFNALAYSHRKEFVRWVTEAKREATRAQRVAKTLEMLRAGEHR